VNGKLAAVDGGLKSTWDARLLESVGSPIEESFNRWIGDRSLDLMRAALGDTGFQTALAEGRSMPFSRAIQFGLEHGVTSSWSAHL
jgi:hypothetical protein